MRIAEIMHRRNKLIFIAVVPFMILFFVIKQHHTADVASTLDGASPSNAEPTPKEIGLSTVVVEAEKKKSEIKNFSYEFVDKEQFFEELHKAMDAWRKKRGYHIEDYFVGYRDLEGYDGQHPYGYLKESELAILAEDGDIDAQVIYSYFYLKNSDPDKAYSTFENIVVNTDQTAPLGSMGVFIITGHANTDQFPDQESRQDEASAIFMLMKERHDPLGEHYLSMTKFDSFDVDRQEKIKQRSVEIAAEFAELRERQGLRPYEDEVFDGARAMDMPKDVFDQLYAEYKKQDASPSAY